MQGMLHRRVLQTEGVPFDIGLQPGEQEALTGGHSFTDIKSQGQTIEVLSTHCRHSDTVNLQDLPIQCLCYVIPEQRQTIHSTPHRLRRQAIQTHPDTDLEAEMQRLGLLATHGNPIDAVM